MSQESKAKEREHDKEGWNPAASPDVQEEHTPSVDADDSKDVLKSLLRTLCTFPSCATYIMIIISCYSSLLPVTAAAHLQMKWQDLS